MIQPIYRADSSSFEAVPASSRYRMTAFLSRCCLALVLSGGIAQPLPGQGTAETHPRKWEFSFLAGAGFLSDGTSGPAEAGNGSSLVTLDYKAGYSMAFGVIENLAEKFGAEMRYGINSLPFGSVGSAEGPSMPERAHYVHELTYSLLVYPHGWKRGRLIPYALAGLGASLFQPSGDADAAFRDLALKGRWKLAGEMGGGVKLYLDPSWSLRFEVRDRLTGVPDYGLPRAASRDQGAGTALPASGRLHHWRFQAGLTYHVAP